MYGIVYVRIYLGSWNERGTWISYGRGRGGGHRRGEFEAGASLGGGLVYYVERRVRINVSV